MLDTFIYVFHHLIVANSWVLYLVECVLESFSKSYYRVEQSSLSVRRIPFIAVEQGLFFFWLGPVAAFIISPSTLFAFLRLRWI